MKHDFSEQLEKDQKEHGSKTNTKYFNVEEGNNNVVRVLTPGAPFVTYFQGMGKPSAVAYGVDKGDPRRETEKMRKSVRYILYVIDRSDGMVKQAEFSYSVMKSIGDLQKNPDYQFDELPMPYDIRITYKKEESPANKYSVAALPKQVPVTTEELADLEAKVAAESPESAVEKKKERQMDTDKESGAWIPEEEREFASADQTSKHKEEASIDINPDDIPF